MKGSLKKIAFALPAVLIILTGSCSSGSRKGWMFADGKRERIISTANRYIGVRYKYGGTTPSGFDCSGFVKYVYQKNGLDLPRSVPEQFRSGKKISIRNAQPGDLVFFHTSSRRLSHVGIYLGKNGFIHSPRTGKTVSHADMANPYWKKRYIGAVSYL